jgi:hypothetical protein
MTKRTEREYRGYLLAVEDLQNSTNKYCEATRVTDGKSLVDAVSGGSHEGLIEWMETEVDIYLFEEDKHDER